MTIQIDTSFPGGALGPVESVADGRVVAAIARDWDQDHLNTQATWYYLRLDGLGGRPCELVLTDLGSVYNGRPSSGGIVDLDQPFVSDDNVSWRKSETATFDEAARTYTIRLEPTGDTLWVAALEPYLLDDVDRLGARVAAHPEGRVEVIGQSVEGRDLYAWTIGDEAGSHSAWLLARQHAWESHTSFCLEGAVNWLLSDAAAAARRACCFQLCPCLDPDGVVAGASRFNRLGWDTNRHWDETDPDNPEHVRQRPEIAAAKRYLRAWLAAGRPVDLHLNLHDTQYDIFVTPPELAADTVLRQVYDGLCAAKFSGGWQSGGGGPAGVCEVGLHREFGLRTALIELGTIKLPTYGRFPTAADRVTFGADLARLLASVVPAAVG